MILAARCVNDGQEVVVDRAQEIGLFRWQIVGEATDMSLSARERGRLVRALAEREHLAPDGRRVRVESQHAGSVDPRVS